MHNGASDAERADGWRLAGSKVLVAEAMPSSPWIWNAPCAGSIATCSGRRLGGGGPALLEQERPDVALLSSA